VISECIFLPINLLLEILLLALQQCASPRKPIFSLIAMILSLVAMFVCIIELFGRGRKAKLALRRHASIRCQFNTQSPTEKPTCSYIDMFVWFVPSLNSFSQLLHIVSINNTAKIPSKFLLVLSFSSYAQPFLTLSIVKIICHSPLRGMVMYRFSKMSISACAFCSLLV
ncbi:hypothetical protein COLO4_00626, partial [Corchorus olitorius]